MFDLVKNFANDESGAVTVDWVVLTAAVVGLAIGVIATVENGVDNVAGRIEGALKNDNIVSVDTN